MKPRPRQSWPFLVVIAALGIILVLLAVLQYRWSGQISAAERARMQAILNTSAGQFRGELVSELHRICSAFQLDAEDFPGTDWPRYARRYELLSARDARLVAGIFIWDAEEGASSRLLRLDFKTGKFEPGPWPPSLEDARNVLPLDAPFRRGPESRPDTWQMIEQVPLLLLPLTHFPQPSGPAGGRPRVFGCLMIELSPEVLWRELIPELAQKYFGSEQGLTYQVAVVRGAGNARVLYQSDPALPGEFFSSPDSRVSLLPGPRDFPPRPPEEGPGGPPPGVLSGQPLPDDARSQFGPPAGRSGNPVRIMPARDSTWTLLARHREGSLDKVVAHQRSRNLAISFGILILLALSMAMILISTRRAQRLAKLQMDFVAGVSHELRTPLSVICSAADNLADGIVAASDGHVRQYGALIRQEGRRLAGMVEQILMFAKSRDGLRKYDLRPAHAGRIVESTLAKLLPAMDQAGFTVENQIKSDLPQVIVDEAALSQCLENLINNAIKYGGSNRWMRVSSTSISTDQGDEVQISVEDKGLGIDRTDLPHIFDPFYRGAAAAVAQIHGSGLGLSLAREGVTAMGGRITVKSTPDVGSVFTIHLPTCAREEDKVTHSEAS